MRISLSVLWIGCEKKKAPVIEAHNEIVDAQTLQHVPVKPPSPKTETPTLEPNGQSGIAADSPEELVAPTLLKKAFSGDAQAKHDLMAIAGDKNAKEIERSVAIQYLVRAGTPESLAIVAAQLASDEPSIRATAYFSLPEKLRPTDFDYTASPSPASRAVVTKLVEQIKQ